MKKVLKNIVNFTIILVVILPLFTTNIFAYEEQEVDKLLEEYKFGEAYKILKENLYDEDKNIDPIKIRKILELEFIVTDTSSMLLHALELVEYGQNSKDYYNQMIGYYYLGSVYYELYDDTKAIENFEKMLSIAQSKNYPLGKGMYYMFTGLIYSSYEDYDLALENFTKAQPYFENAHLDENWIFPNFKENNKFMIDLIEIILSKSQDKASRFVELGDAFKDKNWKLKYSSMSRCGYELNKIGAFKEAAYMLEESKKTIALADFGDMYNKFSGSMDYDLAYSYYNMGDYKRAIMLVVIYAITQIVRQLIQPKLVGDSVGLNPLVTLLLIYIGYRIGGVIWMILAVPVGMVIINMCQAGAFDYIFDDMKTLIVGILKLRDEE